MPDYQIYIRESGHVVLESLTCAVLLLLSFVGNVLVIVVVFKKPRLNSTTSLFIAALATTDLINAVIPGPLFLASLITGKMPFSSTLCAVSGFFMHFLTLASVSTMGLIAINRFFCVLKPNRYRTIFTTRRSAVFLASLWIFIAIVVVFPLIIGWASMKFSPVMAACSLHFNSLASESGFTAFVVLSFVLSSFVIVALCYYFVAKVLRQHRRNLSTAHARGLSVQEINLTKTFFVLVVSFIILWLPTFVVIVLFRVMFHEALPRQLALAIPFELLANSAINPWIYGAMNPSFRKKFMSILKRTEDNRVQPIKDDIRLHQNTSSNLAVKTTELDIDN